MVHTGDCAATVIDTLRSLDLRYPEVGEEKLKELSEARKMLQAEDKPP